MGVGFFGIDIQTDIIVESIICKNMNMRSRKIKIKMEKPKLGPRTTPQWLTLLLLYSCGPKLRSRSVKQFELRRSSDNRSTMPVGICMN